MVPNAGCVTLDGTQSLALVRARKDLQWLVDGHWHLDLTGDLGRMQRQQTFGRAVLAALGDIGTDPVSRAHLLDLFVAHVAMDSYWTREQLDGVLDLARTLGPDDVSTRTVPVTDAVRGGAQVLLPGPAATTCSRPSGATCRTRTRAPRRAGRRENRRSARAEPPPLTWDGPSGVVQWQDISLWN